MKKQFTRVFLLAAIAFFAFGSAFILTACNTVEGMGEDLQGASRSTREAMN